MASHLLTAIARTERATLLVSLHQLDVAVRAWCLMTNHVHLVLVPRQDGAGISSLMEPIIIVVLGTVIGGIVVAMYLPIFKLGQVV